MARLVVVTLFEGVDLLDVTGPAEVFALLARELDGPTGYEVLLAAETVDPVRTSAGVRVLPDATFDDLAGRRVDTLVVGGGGARGGGAPPRGRRGPPPG
ncbi:DJ-1/PfpI family protein, partial [Isoptericola sp. NPDC060185]|uniref:DJ-1/PfpI family protein n=1 Tax=Isoptericola sp. NPDC060185 TaxID=3347065 RepID=UPI003663F1FB